MSRKTLLAVIATLGAIAAFFSEQFGLILDAALVAAFGSILLYIFWEAKKDLQTFKTQPAKWKDPKFWITLIAVMVGAVNQNFGTGIPVELIVAVLTAVVGLLFKAEVRE